MSKEGKEVIHWSVGSSNKAINLQSKVLKDVADLSILESGFYKNNQNFDSLRKLWWSKPFPRAKSS